MCHLGFQLLLYKKFCFEITVYIKEFNIYIIYTINPIKPLILKGFKHFLNDKTQVTTQVTSDKPSDKERMIDMRFKEMKRKFKPVLNLKGFSIHDHDGIEIYIDSLEKYVETEEHGTIELVKPIGRDHTHLFVVCPRCSQIHMYNALRVKKNNGIVYGNCKGRLLFCGEITDMMEMQKPFMIDGSER